MIDALAQAIAERRPYRWDMFVAEALRYVRLEDGKTEASGNQHDDIIMATALAEQLRLHVPPSRQVVHMTEELAILHGGQLAALRGYDPYSPVPDDTYAAGAPGWRTHDGRPFNSMD